MDLVDIVLVLHCYVPLNRFYLKWEGVVHPPIVICWLLKVLDRCVSYLDLYISFKIGNSFLLEMFLSDTLVRLRIGVKDVLTSGKKQDIFLLEVNTLCLDDVVVKAVSWLSLCQVVRRLAEKYFMVLVENTILRFWWENAILRF